MVKSSSHGSKASQLLLKDLFSPKAERQRSRPVAAAQIAGKENWEGRTVWKSVLIRDQTQTYGRCANESAVPESESAAAEPRAVRRAGGVHTWAQCKAHLTVRFALAPEGVNTVGWRLQRVATSTNCPTRDKMR